MGTRFCAFPTLLLGLCSGYTYQASAVSQIYAAINTPTTHYLQNYSWHSYNPDSWTRANYPTPSTAKSIFDPCPYGYRVPTSNDNTRGNSDFFGFTAPSWSGTPVNAGQAFLGSWWSASGLRNSRGAALNSVGGYGYYWSASPIEDWDANYLYFSPRESGYISSILDRSDGLSVRCVQE